MVDWMIEVCTSFSCRDRTWFLAAQFFDRYLIMMKGKKTLRNSDVHAIGVTSMYLASKYEDVYPISSFMAYERISHKAVPQKEILRMEGDFLRLFEFDLELVTHFDYHMYIFGQLNVIFSSGEQKVAIQRIDELSLMLIRMAL
jgi:hypothetical protein